MEDADKGIADFAQTIAGCVSFHQRLESAQVLLPDCQVICGQYIGEPYGSHLIHAHHIHYFVHSLNNNANNIMIVCPNHHAIIHDLNPTFDFAQKQFHYPNGYVEGLAINLHL